MARNRKARKDNNHDEIVSALSAMVPVRALHAAGDGIPDGLAYIKGGWQRFDVKNPKTAYGKRGLNDRQKKWASQPGGPVYLIYNLEHAQDFAAGRFDDLPRFPANKQSAEELLAIA